MLLAGHSIISGVVIDVIIIIIITCFEKNASTGSVYLIYGRYVYIT
jgi:hypothetical protein